MGNETNLKLFVRYSTDSEVESTKLNLMGSDVSPLEETFNHPIRVPQDGSVNTSFERWFTMKQEDIRYGSKLLNFKCWQSTNHPQTGFDLFYKNQTEYSIPQSYQELNWNDTQGFSPMDIEEPTSANLDGEITTKTHQSNFGVMVMQLDHEQRSCPNFTVTVSYDEIAGTGVPNVEVSLQQRTDTRFVDAYVTYPNDIGDFDQDYFVDSKLEISGNHQLQGKTIRWYYTPQGLSGLFQTYEVTTDQETSIWLSDFWDTGRTAKLYQENGKAYHWIFEVVDQPNTHFTISATSVTGKDIDVSYQEMGNDTISVFIEELKIFNHGGTFGHETDVQTLDKDVAITADDVTLRNFIITGNLYIESTVEGTVTLINVEVQGETIILGGGSESIYLNNGSYNDVLIKKVGTPVRIVSNGAKRHGTSEAVQITISDVADVPKVIFGGTIKSISVQKSSIGLEIENESNIQSIDIPDEITDVQVEMGDTAVVETINSNTPVTQTVHSAESLRQVLNNNSYESVTITSDGDYQLYNLSTMEPFVRNTNITLFGKDNTTGVRMLFNSTQDMSHIVKDESFKVAEANGQIVRAEQSKDTFVTKMGSDDGKLEMNWDTLITAMFFYKEQSIPMIGLLQEGSVKTQLNNRLNQLKSYYEGITKLDMDGKTESRFTISTGQLETFIGLEELHLSGVGFTEFGGFLNLDQLQKLDISNNDLVEVNALFHPNKKLHLKELNVSNNQLDNLIPLVQLCMEPGFVGSGVEWNVENNPFTHADTNVHIQTMINKFIEKPNSMFLFTGPQVGVSLQQNGQIVDQTITYPDGISGFNQNYFVDAKLELQQNHGLNGKIVRWYYTQEGTDGPYGTYTIPTTEQTTAWLSNFQGMPWGTGRHAKFFQENNKTYLWKFEVQEVSHATFTISATSIIGYDLDRYGIELGTDEINISF